MSGMYVPFSAVPIGEIFIYATMANCVDENLPYLKHSRWEATAQAPNGRFYPELHDSFEVDCDVEYPVCTTNLKLDESEREADQILGYC